MRQALFASVSCALLIHAQGRLGAAAPNLDYLFPAGGTPGSEVLLTLGGKQEGWPVDLWSHPAGLELKAGETAGEVQVKVAPDARPGPFWIRAANGEGVSDPRLFLVGLPPSIQESEPNNAPGEAQVLAGLPVTVDGRLEKSEDVDAYRVRLEAGQVLVARLHAYGLDSPMDAVLQLTDADNSTLTVNHDGVGLDPELVWPAATAGDYIVKVAAFAYPPQANVRFASGANTVYRLDLHAGPYAMGAWPAGVAGDRPTRVEILGWNLAETPRVVEVDPGQAFREEGRVLVRGFENALWLPVDPHPGVLEKEPNNRATEATPLPVPGTMHGHLGEAKDVDRLAFQAVKDRVYTVRVRAATLGYAGDLTVAVEDEGGKQLGRNDDAESRPDPWLRWTAPADGTFQVVITDLFSRGGGEAYRYVADVAEDPPAVRAETKAHTVTLAAGGTAELKVDVKREGGFKGKVVVFAGNLPAGVTAEPVEAGEKGGETTLTFKAEETAPAGHTTIEMRLRAEGASGEEVLRVGVPVKGKFAEAGDLLLNELPGVWLTVKAKAE